VGVSVIPARDSGGAELSRVKITKTGLGLQCHAIEFATSTVGSVVNIDKNGDDYGFATLKFYDDQDNELTTQIDIDSDCVTTVLVWEPTYDIDIIGGEMRQKSVPASPVRCNFYSVYSGHEFCSGGMNMEYVGAGSAKRMDGRAPKTLPYVEGIGITKFHLVCRHPAGFQHSLMCVLEFFK